MSLIPDPLEIQEGEEFTLDLPTRWGRLQPTRGDVVEVHLASTDHLSVSPYWAGFLVMETVQDGAGAFACRAKFLGAPDPTIAKEFSNKFNRRTSWLHFCLHRPCFEAEEEYGLHVTRARWWSLSAFETDYMTSQVRRQARKWAGVEKEKETAPPIELPQPLGAMPKSGARPADDQKDYDYEPSLMETPLPPGLEIPAPGVIEAEKPPAEEEKRQTLRERLQSVRERLARGAGSHQLPPTQPTPAAGIGDAPYPEPSRKRLEGQRIHAGSTLQPGLAPVLAVPPEVTRDGTLKLGRGPGRDLVLQAMKTMTQKERNEKKRKKKKDKGRRAAEAFRDLLQGKRKKKKKKKKSKGGQGPGGPPSSSSSSKSSRSQEIVARRGRRGK